MERRAVGLAMRKLRSSRGMSQEDLALVSGMHRTYVGSIERGERNPSLVVLTRVATALGVRPWELLRLADELHEAATGSAQG
ncbi:MAG: helix-turn-helix domain-containing protein [Solirubrobacteraceae bacterium]